MKKIITYVLVFAAFLVAQNNAEAQTLKNAIKKVIGNSTTTEKDATASGKAAGVALKALYTQYKADGKVKLSNLNNVANLTTLATNLQELKGKSNKTQFYKDFASGLINGSGDLVTEKNSSTVMTSLSSIAETMDLSKATSKKSSTSDLAGLADSVSDLLSLLKK